MSAGPRQGVMQVGVVGAGPRGLWATEALLERAGRRGVAVAVTVFDERTPGAGSAYGVDQPTYWRLNVNASIVRTALGTFDDWRRARGDSEPLDPFPARALVGEFLAASWRALGDSVPNGCSLTHVRRRVGRVSAAGEGWALDGQPFDEVLLATGHAKDWPGALQHRWAGPARLVPNVVWGADLGPDAVPPGAHVAVRGAALTFIDAALMVTMGRGGRFVDADESRYVPTGGEPAVIWPTGRTGRFMQVKADPIGPLAGLVPAGLAAHARNTAEASDLPALMDALAAAAVGFLDAAAVEPDRDGVTAVLAGTDASEDPVDELRQSVAVARGVRPPGAVWAAGEAWRRLYPQIVARVGFGGRETLPGFDTLARRMERVAFGPPPVNGSRLLALVDAGLVDATHLGDTEAACAQADVVIDAVLAPPGGASGLVTIEPDATVVGAPHLGLVGRDSEAVTLGNDTLSRTLDAVIERWADRVINRAGTLTPRPEAP